MRHFVLAVFLAGGALAYAQGISASPELFSNDLVAWAAIPAPEAAGQDNAAPAHTVTGSISKEGDTYVLRVSDTTSYQLDDQAKAKQFNGQKVRVTGEVDLNTNQIHVQKIEPLV